MVIKDSCAHYLEVSVRQLQSNVNVMNMPRMMCTNLSVSIVLFW